MAKKTHVKVRLVPEEKQIVLSFLLCKTCGGEKAKVN